MLRLSIGVETAVIKYNTSGSVVVFKYTQRSYVEQQLWLHKEERIAVQKIKQKIL